MRKTLAPALLALTLNLTMAGGWAAAAQEHHEEARDNHRYVEHKEWRKGARMRDEDWRRAEKVDWARYHLSRPPAGYEWRLVDGNYVLAAVATGLIASVVVASTIH